MPENVYLIDIITGEILSHVNNYILNKNKNYFTVNLIVVCKMLVVF